MISAYLQGGLGNQMFQIAAAISLAEDNDAEAIFNIEHHDLPFQGRKCKSYLNSILRHVNFSPDYRISQVYREPFFHYSEIPYVPDVCIMGYFQSEKYFENNKDLIQKTFSVDEDRDKLIIEKYSNVLKLNPVGVHVRRGDYLSNAHPVCSRDYYDKAFKTFPENTVYLLFSDDIDWCKENFKGKHFYFSDDNEDVVDLFLMTKCSHNIIANSSFSWWGAWLNKNEDQRVITPRNWFGDTMKHNTKDLRPSEWELI